MKIHVFPRVGLFGRQWYFRIVAKNGRTVAQSEGYRNRGDCVSTALMLRRNLFDAELTYA
jgi:uncharacterized protein YegP (UPF0339 family)